MAQNSGSRPSWHIPTLKSTRKPNQMSTQSGERRVTGDHRLIHSRCMWSRQTRLPLPVGATLVRLGFFLMAWSSLGCKVQTANILVLPNSAKFRLSQKETPQNFPKGQTELVFSCGYGTSPAMGPFTKLLLCLGGAWFPNSINELI